MTDYTVIQDRESGDNPRMLDAMTEGDRVTYIVGRNGSIGSVMKIERPTS